MKSLAGSDNDTDGTECTRALIEGNQTGGCTGTIRGAAPLTTDAHSSTDPNSANKTFIANKTFMNRDCRTACRSECFRVTGYRSFVYSMIEQERRQS